MLLVDLDDTRCLESDFAGAKASRLARARCSGLPVLPGLVLPTEASRKSLTVGARALEEGGSGAARLAVMECAVPEAVTHDVDTGQKLLGAQMIVRSSSVLETGGVWSGAFSTFEDVRLHEVPTAVRGVWASIFTVHTLERFEHSGLSPADADMAVLVQPQITPEVGGLAMFGPHDEVRVSSTSGPLAHLTAGWTAGSAVTVHADGRVEGAGEREDSLYTRVRDLLCSVRAELGDDMIEWAEFDGDLLLLQSGRSARRASETRAGPSLELSPAAMELALGAARYPGALGEELVLPWYPALRSPLGTRGRSTSSSRPLEDLAEATELAESLWRRAWSALPGVDRSVVDGVHRELLAGASERASRTLEELRVIPAEQAARVVDLVEGVGRAAAAAGWIGAPEAVWRYTSNEVRSWFDASVPSSRVPRTGTDRWEPFVFSAVSGYGWRAEGLPAASGTGAGRVVVVTDPHHPPRLSGREVVVAEHPFPGLAPLIWDAAALVTFSGNPAAHLMEVAASLGVPTVVGVRAEGRWPDLVRAADQRVAAVDGDSGEVFFLD